MIDYIDRSSSVRSQFLKWVNSWAGKKLQRFILTKIKFLSKTPRIRKRPKWNPISRISVISRISRKSWEKNPRFFNFKPL